MQKITPFLWFNDNAEEAANFYVSLFKNSKVGTLTRYDSESAKMSGMKEGTAMTVGFQLDGQEFAGINGGPMFTFTQAISFFTYCNTEQEIDELFGKLSAGGEIMMPLAKYPFGEKYAFFKDRFGLSWQLMLSPDKHGIIPSLLFVGNDLGKAEAAVKFYTSVFKNTSVDHISLYEEGMNGKPGTVQHSSFFLEGQEFMAMDGTGPHKFTFNEAVSFVVNCATQEEIDYFWEKLTAGGAESQCGWLKDQFGVSWQIVPTILPSLLKDPNKAKKVMGVLMQMKKLDIAKLQVA